MNRTENEQHRLARPWIDRRKFLTGAAAGGFLLVAPELRRSHSDMPTDGKLRLGAIADVHQDIMHDGVERIETFVSSMKNSKAQAIVNLGDFCVPHSRNDAFLSKWNTFSGEKFHVLGNHDTDGGYQREQVLEYYGSPARYFSQDLYGIHFIILDGNDPDGKPGYPCNVNDTQLMWLEQDLQKTKLPCVILIHQPIDGYDSVELT